MPANYLPDLQYLPDNLTQIDAKTKLSYNIRLSRFLKGNTLNHITDIAEKKQIVRNLLPHAELIRMIEADKSEFADYTLEVVEGVYKPGPEEIVTAGSLNDLKSKGRAVVYELKLNGVTDIAKTFEVASYIRTYYRHFDKLYLDYDQYDPTGALNAQIIIETPNIPDSYHVRFNKKVVTLFNNEEQGVNELIQIDEQGITTGNVLSLSDVSTAESSYWTIGDSQARRAALNAGTPWSTFAGEGYTSRDSIHMDSLARIKEGSTVVISLGENDVNNTNDRVEEIAERIYHIAFRSRAMGHETVFLLLPIGNTAIEERRRALRAELQRALTSFHIIDLEEPEFELARDGRHVTPASYQSALRRLL